MLQAMLALRDSPYGFGVGKIVPHTNLPTRLDRAMGERLPAWDGRLPYGVPVGSVPFYNNARALAFLGIDGKVYDPQGYANDNIMAGSIAARLGLTRSDYLDRMREMGELVGRPLTMSEVYAGAAKVGAPPVDFSV